MRPTSTLIRSLLVVAAVLALLCVAPSVWAGVALSDLIMNNGSVISGDKLFDRFSYSHTGNMPSGAGVEILPVQNNGQYGIRVFGGFSDLGGSGPSTATLGYRVTVLDPNLGITGGLLYGNPAVLTNGFFTIEASFASLPPSKSLMIYDKVPGGTSLWDDVEFDSVYPSVEVQVNLTGDTTSASGAVTASFFDTAFTQGVVPEPASLLIWMGSALLFGVVAIVQRRRQPSVSPAGRAA